jgi:hypothetical protein
LRAQRRHCGNAFPDIIMPMTASESPALPCPALLLNITDLGIGKSAAYVR